MGQRLYELRDRAGLTLRELAEKVGISGPFLSDIELGRRFPSEEILAKLGRALNISLQDLKLYDNREVIADLKRIIEVSPKLGFAFRIALEKVKRGELTAEDIIDKLGKSPRNEKRAQGSDALWPKIRDGKLSPGSATRRGRKP